MFRRSLETNCAYEFLQLSRNNDQVCGNLDSNPKSGGPSIENSSIVIASGQHDLHYIKMDGRVQIDLYNYFRRDFNLTSYKLDYVSGYFIGDSVISINHENNNTIIESKNLAGLEVGSYIHFEESSHSVDYYKDGDKFKVIKKNESSFEIESLEYPNMNKHVRWCLAKDDVTPQDIFEKTNGSDEDRCVIAKYCIQDCNLVHELLKKIDVITGFIEMAKICSVPISYLVLRGQGIKLTSFISQKCSENDTLMPVIEKKEYDDGYEGAIVLDPKCNLYLEDPVACVDYGSLYPSSMISENLCHSSKVWTKEYDLYNNLVCECGEKDINNNYIYDNLKDYTYVDITYDTFKYVRKTEKSAAVKVKKGYKICRFAQYPNGKAILPSVLEELLKSRKATKKLMAKETDPFMKNILDKRQLSIKLTANSLYGQCGARTSTFYEKDVAASTTATGRKLLTYAKKIIEEVYGNNVCETKNYGKVRTNAEYIYGDTDSVFFCFYLKEMDGTPIKNKKALEITIELAQQAGELASKFLKKPHDLEYEKTFLPFCLLSKKRYVGMLYEFDHNKCKRKSMGIVLKRRDNAPIVKDVYGGIIDILMKEQNISKAIEFLKKSLQSIIDEKCPIEKLIITKSLRSNYKNPETIAHKVLADRMGTRDPGNKPSVGDRIPFAYIVNNDKKALQGDKIEHPEYIKSEKLKLDYGHYITNQIMKPVQQVFALVLEEIPSFKSKILKRKKFKESLEYIKNNEEPDKIEKKIEKLRNDEIKQLLFDSYIRHCNNLKNNNKPITSFFL
jgi:DNA polymerase elongation subunit (family B)